MRFANIGQDHQGCRAGSANGDRICPGLQRRRRIEDVAETMKEFERSNLLHHRFGLQKNRIKGVP